ncbi:MAG: hypothetical protein D6806_07630 [Deltaproteobacteria bacterium]|nr:MAG: hypothetical protein D6806_07630 [Deltaproteobacteria bacterium]
MSINGTPPSGGASGPRGPLPDATPIAEKARRGAATRAKQKWDANLAYVQRGYRRMMEKLRSEMAADGKDISIKASLEGDPVILVTDKYTGKVIREIPPEVLRRVAAKLEQLRGLFVDRKG